jgi:hypothetical protein
LLISSISRIFLLFHSSSSYLGPYILLNIFLLKMSRDSSSFFVIVHVFAPYATMDLISALYSRILVGLDGKCSCERKHFYLLIYLLTPWSREIGRASCRERVWS